MDSTVIQEIANQLGMAVDQAGQFITEHLPEFAAMKAMQIQVFITLAAVLLIICAIAAIGTECAGRMATVAKIVTANDIQGEYVYDDLGNDMKIGEQCK